MMAIDQEKRNQLVEAIDRYLHEEITAFEFDEAIFDIRTKTSDETIKGVVDFLWCFYDDCDDHKVVLDRAGWNCFQRLRLLLKSDATLKSSQKRIWSLTQIIAALAIAAFAWVAVQIGWGSQLLAASIPFGVVSICLYLWRCRLYRNAATWDESVYPFSSVSQLLWVAHGVSGFRKEKHPLHLATRRIRGRVGALANWGQIFLPWLLLSPAVLVAQLWPIKVPVRKVLP